MAVIIPCYRVKRHVLQVIGAIGSEVSRIYCVDDGCPEGSGDYILEHNVDPRVQVLRNAQNQGVGGAVMTGYRAAIDDGYQVLVKIDGDGQMDPALLPEFVNPIALAQADYTKGNRFWELTQIKRMPMIRRLGNLGLSFMAKASSGYWDIFDPTNGYTAIHANVAARLPFDSISKRYFFETDILFRLNTLRAVVKDIPMDAHYADETSNLKISNIVGEFAFKHARNLFKRIGYSYFLRDLPVASIELLAAIVLLSFGVVFGSYHWLQSGAAGVATPVGTIMLSIVAITTGLQFMLAFVGYDIGNTPRTPLHPLIRPRPTRRPKQEQTASD
ncbi:glycosyltransferase [Luteimonas sp. S4-F44]|uniref:glycosyltransferase n=1 Tax=Luteimonas sp. S4-F44 TaxID=2925842 RepID=UPI001F534F59|nr:glycosyltransferase [Luteimonas sp. S4-F44]UNK41906.1 glycosyltransferase [Luteimonas sp. S4-F44]